MKKPHSIKPSGKVSALSSIRPIFQCLLACLVLLGLGVNQAEAHPPRKKVAVKFTLSEKELICTAEIHFSQLFPLKKKQLKDVGEKDYASILRSISMNCPVIVNGDPVKPKLVSCKFPNQGKALDEEHYHDEDEMRFVTVELRYLLSQEPETISVDWKLIPQNEGTLKIPFPSKYNPKQVFTVSHSSTQFTWKKTPQKK